MIKGKDDMELQFLGTGAGMPSKMRNTSSAVILNLSAKEKATGYLIAEKRHNTKFYIRH